MKETLQKTFPIPEEYASKRFFDELQRLSGDSVAISLFFFICKQQAETGFPGSGTIEIKEFGEQFKYTNDYLTSLIKQPYQNTTNPPKRYFCKIDTIKRRLLKTARPYLFDKRIENTLLIMADHRFVLDTFNSTRILKNIGITQDIKNGRISYNYILNRNFLKKLRINPLNVNLESINRLKRKSLVPLYLLLLKIINELYAQGKTKTHPGYISMEQLQMICNVNPNQHSKYCKRDIKERFKVINKDSEINIKLSWQKNEQKEKHIPILSIK